MDVSNGCGALLPLAASAVAAAAVDAAPATAAPLLVRVVQLSIIAGYLWWRSVKDVDKLQLARICSNMLLYHKLCCCCCCCAA